MKKNIYIFLGFLIILLSYQPTKNWIANQKRLQEESYINSLVGDKFNYDEMKASTRKDQRPDLRGLREYLMTYDLSTKRIPKERLIEGIEEIKRKRNSLEFSRRMTEVDWEERGPNNIGGRTRALMLDPNDGNKLWAAGVSGGLWYNNNITSESVNWTLVDATWSSLAVSSITYDPNDTNTMYVGTGERMGNYSSGGSNWYSPGVSRGLGLWKTTDGGTTWNNLTTSQNFAFINDILVKNESGTSVIYIGVGGNEFEGSYVGRDNTGLWKSSDGGTTWSRTFNEQETTGFKEVGSIDMDSNGRIWIGTRMNSFWSGGGEIYYSDDGDNWTQSNWRSGGLGSPNRVLIDVADSDPNYVYALISNNAENVAQWIAKSSDGGTTWTELSVPNDSNGNPLGDANGQAGYSMSFAIDPSNPQVLYAGEIDMFKSSDGGTTWTQLSGGGSGTSSMHVDQHTIKFIDSNKVIFSNDGGVYYSSNAGVQIPNRNQGYNVSQFYSVALHPDSNSKYVLGGTQDNGSWKVEGTSLTNGTYLTGGDGGFSHIDQEDPNYQFVGSNYNTIYRSTNGGNSWSLYSSYEVGGADTGTLINPTGIDDGTKTLYANVDGSTILRLPNYTQLATTQTMSINLGSQSTFFVASPHTSDVMFVGTQGGRIFKITDASTANFSVEDISGSNISGYISSIDIGANDNQILATVSNYGAESIFETYSGGGSNGWRNVEGDLPDIPVRGALYNKDNFNQVIVATDLGTWTSDDISISNPAWNPSNDGLANVRVDMLKRRTDGAMAAGTHGRGMFFSSGFSSTAPLNAAFTPDKTSGVFPLTVSFNDRSTGNVNSWSWDFGDGNTSSDSSPSHTFASAGKYNVTLQISDGSSTDSITKTDLIWATAQQDTLWEEGFETNPYGWADGRRDVHAFSSINANNDADDFSWWYYTAGFGAADGSHWMAGLGYAGAGTADDWLISPRLWLRPGTDNILSFYSNMNGGSEDYDVLLSPSGGTSIEDFTITLANIEGESTNGWTQQSYDLTSYAGTDIRVAIHVSTANQQYAFWDNFTLTAGQLSPDGSPIAPQGLTAEAELEYDSANTTWIPTSDGIGIYWNRNLESDFASYNVYGSLTEGFNANSNTLLGQGTLGNIDSEHLEPSPSTSPWPDTTFVFRQTFGVDSYVHDGLNQGEKWYYKVGAVDNDGNETIGNEVSFLLDSQNPTAGTVTISDIYDTNYLRSTTEISITIDGWSDNTGIETYFMGIGSSGDDTSADIVPYTNVGLSDLSLSDLTLDDFSNYFLKVVARDGSGNLSTFVIEEFNTYTTLLGDSDNDWDVDVTDLNAFVSAWPNVDIGPASGASPYPTPSLDGTADINDISVFSRNWLWTKAQGRIAQESQEIIPIEFDAEVVGNQIIIELPQGITAGRFELSNLNNIYTFKASNKEGYMVLENTDQENQYYEFEFGNLSSNDNQLIITVEGAAIKNDIEFSYQLFSKDGLAGNGMIQLSNPDEFKLYQNYPNPFNNQTTIKYDIPTMMVNMVDVEIHIYNTLGKLVKTIDEGDKSVGQYTTVWDGKNDDGDNVSSGVYFYQLRAKVDGQSDFNKTMKMVIVR